MDRREGHGFVLEKSNSNVGIVLSAWMSIARFAGRGGKVNDITPKNVLRIRKQERIYPCLIINAHITSQVPCALVAIEDEDEKGICSYILLLYLSQTTWIVDPTICLSFPNKKAFQDFCALSFSKQLEYFNN